MVKANRQGSQKSGVNDSPLETSPVEEAVDQSLPPAVSRKKQNRQSGKYSKAFGGSAVPGAKSTQVKDLSNGTPSNQQPDYYNRETRRRMQQMGTGPYTDRTAADPRSRRKKRLDRIKERQEQMRHTVETKGPSRDIRLGRRNTYFLIGSILLLVGLIVAFLLIRHPF
jgi:hypothetical protein